MVTRKENIEEQVQLEGLKIENAIEFVCMYMYMYLEAY